MLGGEKFDAVFDMNAREVSDTKAIADVFKGKVDHYVFMSSAGVYLKSELMPHREVGNWSVVVEWCCCCCWCW